MIVGNGIGDDGGGDGVGPNYDGIYFTLAIVGLFTVFSMFRNNSVSHSNRRSGVKRTGGVRKAKVSEQTEYKLEVDVTGRGNWVEQARGSKREVGKVATQVRNQEGMKTRLVAL